MSTLTWDNLDEWVSGIPRGEDGHFITPKPVEMPKHGFVGTDTKAVDEFATDLTKVWNEGAKFAANRTEEDCKLYPELKADVDKALDTFEPINTLRNYSEQLDENAEVVHMRFGDGSWLVGLAAKFIPGVASKLIELGKLKSDKVPEDVLISGFDSMTDDEQLAFVRDSDELLTDNGDCISTHYQRGNELWLVVFTKFQGEVYCNRKLTGTINDNNTFTETFASEVREVDINAKLNGLNKIDPDQAEQAFDPLAKARHALKDLDTSDAEAEFKEMADGIEYRKGLAKSGLLRLNNSPLLNPNMSKEELAEYQANLAAYHDSIRKEVVERMDKDMEHGGRVSVGEKYLLNCKADLNQLIPFKYVWAWDYYIKSNEHHWMPGEFSLENCKPAYSALAKNEKLIVARAYYIAQYRKRLFPETALVNFYRLCTNPEVREYQLRQAMEFLQNHHAWMDLDELFKFSSELIDGKTSAVWLKPKEQDTLTSWYELTMKHTKYAHDLTSVTNTQEGLNAFIKAYTILHMHTNFINQLVPYYQVIKLSAKYPGLGGLGEIFVRLLRDIRMQYGFSKLFLAQLLEEENGSHTNELISDINGVLKKLSNITLDFADTLRLDPEEFTDINNVIVHYTDEVMSIINPMHETRKLNPAGTGGLKFIEVVENSVKAKEHGESQSNGSLGWAE